MKVAHALAALALFGAGVAQAQGWSPQKNVELVVPSAPGGTNDKLARAIEITLTGGKRALTVVHKAGGGGQIAYGYLAQHAGDPHYLVVAAPTLLTAHITGTSRLSYTELTLIASIFNAYWEGAMRKVVESTDWKTDLERYFWSDYFATGAALRKNVEKEYAETKAVLTELGLAK